MDHDVVVRENIAERYLRNELYADQEIVFEEHLLHCSVCRAELQKLESVKEGIHLYYTDKFLNPDLTSGKKTKLSGISRLPLIKYAAVIALLTGITAILLLVLKSRDIKPDDTGIAVSGSKESESIISAEQQSNEISADDATSKVHSDIDLIANNFQQNPFYENLVENHPRYMGITITSPKDDTLYYMPPFVWHGTNNNQLTLVIMDNKEKILLKKEIAIGYIPDILLIPGCYYWQLHNNDESLYTGRFIYLPSAADK